MRSQSAIVRSITAVYTVTTVPASQLPTTTRQRHKYQDIEAAVRACPAGEIVRITWPGQDNRRKWAMNVRTAMVDRGLRVSVKSDAHYFYIVPKKPLG